MTPDFMALVAEVENRESLIFKPSGSATDWLDLNAVNRSRVITGLQYSGAKVDTETLIFLLDQEILRAENDPFQGMGEDLEYTAYLLSLQKDPSHAHLFLRAKRANFDCHCGFDSLYVVSSGLEPLRTYLESGDVPNKRELLDFLDGFALDQDELKNWWEGKAEYFGETWLSESPSYRISRLQYLGLEELAQTTLKNWESQAPTKYRDLQSLRRSQKSLQKFASATQTSEMLLRLELSQQYMISEWGEKTDSLRRDGQFDEAFVSLQSYLSELKKLKNWSSLGYGRNACVVAFQLALHNFAHQQRAFELADELQKRLSNTPLAVLEVAYLAARSQGPLKAIERYEALALREASRIEHQWDPEESWREYTSSISKI